MQRRFAFLAVALVGSTLVACGGQVSGGTTTGSSPPPTPLSGGACAASTQDVGTWFMAGANPRLYTMGLDPAVNCSGGSSVSIASSTASSDQFGTFMTERSPAALAGHRVRLAGFARSDSVTGWAGLWLRVDGESKGTLGFDNMQNRPITGTTDWAQYEVVLDVPPQATNVAYGLLLAGSGQVWLDGVSLDVVDGSVPTTGP
jgi:hypothetical protein